MQCFELLYLQGIYIVCHACCCVIGLCHTEKYSKTSDMCLVDRYTRTIGTRTAAHIYVYPLRDSLVVCALSGVFVVVCRGWGGGHTVHARRPRPMYGTPLIPTKMLITLRTRSAKTVVHEQRQHPSARVRSCCARAARLVAFNHCNSDTSHCITPPYRAVGVAVVVILYRKTSPYEVRRARRAV